ncbi:septin-2-like isoform X1 [Tachypleus tridentatus]|uniref:septin-2-like isoform X1 n=2 Tax=Tachypleus tridentatus TaxID=6853 RepID=UPI003FD57AF2
MTRCCSFNLELMHQSFGEIGFATLPEQIHRKSVKKGFDFTMMVVGESGLGKSTLINSLFLTDLYKERKILNVEEKLDRTVDVEKKTMEIEEKGVKLKLTIVDTPGFGDAVNCEENWMVIENYITDQFNQFFKDESGLNRKNIVDNRVHCCLYFIPPWGHGLRPLDVEFMKRLHQKVNIVPVIAKADTLNTNEIRRLKDKILRELEENEVHVYQLPECDSDEDDEFKQQDRELKQSIPFAVIGSTQVVEVNGRRVRGRIYPWGIVEVENPVHSDFLKLRTFLVSTHMQDLKDVTRDVHYENYRAQYLTKISQQSARERGKLRRDSKPCDESAVETDWLLQQKEEEIRRMQDMLNQMQQKLKAAGRDSSENGTDSDSRKDTESVDI